MLHIGFLNIILSNTSGNIWAKKYVKLYLITSYVVSSLLKFKCKLELGIQNVKFNWSYKL